MSWIISRSGLWMILPSPVLEREAGDGGQVAAFGDFLAGEIEFLAAHPIDGVRRFQRFRGQHHGMGADEPDGGLWPLRLDGFGDFAVIFERRRGGVDDDVVELFGDGEAFREVNVMRGASSRREWGTRAAGWASQVGYQKLVTSRRA